MKGYQQISRDERLRIETLLDSGMSCGAIAQRLGRQRSTLWRERQRNRNADGSYHAASAQQRAQSRPRGRPPSKIRPPSAAEPAGSAAWQFVWEKLVQGDLSPQLIAGRWPLEDAAAERLCAETIYRFIYAPAQSGLRLWQFLLRQHRQRRRRGARAAIRGAATRGPRLAMRPAAANARRECGHWEADLLCQSRPGAVVLHVVERLSRYRFALKLHGKHAAPLMQALSDALAQLPSILRESLTVDNGSEFACWPQLLKDLGLATYFCDPHAPWQKGTIEALNGVLRRFLPRQANLNALDQEELTDICETLNDRPMQVLGFRTPREVLHSELGLNVALHP